MKTYVFIVHFAAFMSVATGHVRFGSFETEEHNNLPDGVAYLRQPDTHTDSRGNKHISGRCSIPEKWKGKWFQSGMPNQITIDNNKITEKGTCVESQGDKYLFFENPWWSLRATDCYKCLVINDRHANVLQYKESQFCEEKNTLEKLCNELTGDSQLYSLFRIDAPLTECPFKGAPYTFTYNRGYGECRNPVSHVDSCTDNTKLLLRYQACPDVPKTESLEEELHCIASWKEGAQHYLVGKIHHRLVASHEDSYRCFAFEKFSSHSHGGAAGGYKVAQSGDATCTGVTSSIEGARTLTFHKKIHQEVQCKFPVWFAHHWHTLNGKMTAKFHHKEMSTLFLTEDSRKNASLSHSNSVLGGGGGGFGSHSRSGPSSWDHSYWFSGGSKITCGKRTDHSDRHTTIIARHLNGCQAKSICMQIFRRDSHVVEVKIRKKEDDSDDCEKDPRDSSSRQEEYYAPRPSSSFPFVTLVSSDPGSHRCPYLGKYTALTSLPPPPDSRNARDLCNHGGSGHYSYHSLVVGCGDRAKMEFHSKCPTQEPTTKYECHGHWEEEGLGFLIATPMSRSSTTAHRYCFVYTENADGSLRVYSSSESCRRNINLNTESSWAFNRTSDGQCAEAVTAGAASIQTCDTHLTYAFSSIIFVLLISILSNCAQQVNQIDSSSRRSRKPSSKSEDQIQPPEDAAVAATTTKTLDLNPYRGNRSNPLKYILQRL